MKTKFLTLKEYIKSMWIPVLTFLVYGILSVGKFWHFKNSYFLGLKILDLPLEEYFFFIIASYISMFLWKNFSTFFEKKNKIIKYSKNIIPFISLALLAITSLLNLLYTWSVILMFLIIYLIDFYQLETKLLKQRLFLVFLGIMLILSFLLDYYLISKPIVMYNSTYKTNINILNVPIEDLIYGLNFIYICSTFYSYNRIYEKKQI